MQGKDLEEKAAISRAIIREAIKSAGRPAVAYSGGRDSTVLLDLVLREEPAALVVHNNTGLGAAETLEFIRQHVQRLGIRDNYRETRADDAIAMWQEKGYYPILSKRGFTGAKKRDPGLRISPVQCCYQLKEKYSNTVFSTEGVGVVFWGNRAAESMRRRMTFIDNGYLFKPKKYPWHQGYPLQHWLDLDILDYLEQEVPGYPDPAGGLETGCVCCGTDLTFWPNNLSRLYQRDRERWEFYMRAGFAEQIMRIKGIPGKPEDIITARPEALLHIRRGGGGVFKG